MDGNMLVLAGGGALIGLIVWWFFGKHATTSVQASQVKDRQVVEIIVDGGYKPGVVELQAGVPADLVFVRKDTSSCFDEVVLPDFGQKAALPVGEPHTLHINPSKTGEYTYSCGMRMFFGKVVVK